ncbi:MAG: hypothetical protein ABR924_05085 [Terracidiphilus sp.]
MNQNDKHDDKQNGCNNPNDRNTVHFNFPFLQQQAAFIPQPEPCKSADGARASRRPAQKTAEAVGKARDVSRRRRNTRAVALLDPCAAALDQNDKHDDKQNAGNNPNDRNTVHFRFLLPQ